MPDALSLARLGRSYLETYYPSHFDEEAFHQAILAIDERFRSGQERIDVETLSAQYGLPHAIIENASILFHLSDMAEVVARAPREGGLSVLDVGGGPTIYQHIPISLIADTIIHAEPLEENRREVLEYLGREPNAYDWSAYFRVLKKYLEESGKFSALSKKLTEISSVLPTDTVLSFEAAWRMLVTELIGTRVVPCDAFSWNLESEGGSGIAQAFSDAGIQETVTLVESNFLLESATDSIKEWQVGLDTLARKVAPGGFLSMMAIRNAHWYRSGSEQVPAVPVNEIFLRTEFESRKFSVIQMRVLTGSDRETFGYDGMVFVLAQKNVP